MEIKPIAHIYTDFKEKFGIPRQSGRVPELSGRIVFVSEFSNPEVIRGLEEFSHIWLIFGFSEATYKSGTMTVRPPRLGGNKRVGIFSSRSPYRPNSLGLSCVKITEIKQGEIIVSGVDILNNTPIYDIKPYISYSDCIRNARGSFDEANREHSLDVKISKELLSEIPDGIKDAVVACLSDDPRPSYHNDDREYSMAFSDFDIRFTVNKNILTVININKRKR